MKRFEKIIVCILMVCMLATVVGDTLVSMQSGEANVESAFAATYDKKGTEISDDTFVVLEVIPHKNNAEFGWLVGGSEPKEIDKISLSDAKGKYNEFLTTTKMTIDGEQKEVVVNRELFKRNSLALQYVDNNINNEEDISGFKFAGWYKDQECNEKFDENELITEDITLYAKWINNRSSKYSSNSNDYDEGKIKKNIDKEWEKLNKLPEVENTGDDSEEGNSGDETETSTEGDESLENNEPIETCTITFNANKPNKALATPKNMPTKVEVAKDQKLKLATYPMLQGNIDYKIENTKVVVVPQTPSDLKTDNGKALIDRANLIIVTDQAGCSFTNDPKRFFDYDIDFNTAYRILKKMAVDDTSCPVILSESIYRYPYDRYNDDWRNAGVTIKRTIDKRMVGVGWINNSDNNAYKLYLMLRQMSPATVYNAYLSNGKIDINTGESIVQKQLVQTYNDNKEQAERSIRRWDILTLLPEFITNNDWEYRSDNLFRGFNIDPETTKSPRIYFNSYVNSDDNGIVAGFSSQSDYKNNNFTVARSIYELLNDTNVTVRNNDVRILEIQPCKDFSQGDYWYWFLHGAIDGFAGDVTVNKFSSSEFVGSIEDLNCNYDLVYIGTNNNGLLDIHKPDGCYNMVYSHLGKSTYGDSNLRGTLAGDADVFDKYYYSGNDITRQKMNELLEFAASKKPIIFEQNAIRNNGGKLEIDTNIIDSASYMFELGRKALEDDKYYCFGSQGIANNEEFLKAISKKSLVLNMLKEPIPYKDRTSDQYKNQGLIDRDIYINGVNRYNKNLSFKFEIQTEISDTADYEVRLFIDSNADGRYDKVEERLDNLEVYDETAKRNVRPNKLVAGHTYTLSRSADEYVGILPWKIEVSKVSDYKIRADELGMAAIKPDPDNEGNVIKEELKVLQIVPTRVSVMDAQVYLPTKDEIEQAVFRNGNPFYTSYTDFRGIIKNVNDGNNVGDNIADVTGKFWYYTKDLDDFNITYERIPRSYCNGVKGLDDRLRENPNFLDNYNMLIIGFQDCYSDITDQASLLAIEDYIYQGKSVLFTHDTTSYVNVSEWNFNRNGQDSTYWGYNINQYFRDLLGLDRFGVTITKGTPYYEPKNEKERQILAAKDVAYAPNTRQSSPTVDTETRNGITKNLIQGFSNSAIAYFNDRTRKVSITNRGQITDYPYYIQDEFDVAETHGQYYQLDLEKNDIVVWYTLTGDYGTNYYQSANDVRNSFYIYNKGNITYTGVGHSGDLTDNEIKLFINTMIAAYSAAASASKPVIINREKSSDNNNNDYLYVDYNSNDALQPVGSDILVNEGGKKVKRTYFKLKNNSIVNNKEMTLFIYPATVEYIDSENGTKKVQVTGDYSNNLPLDVFDADTGAKLPKKSVTFERLDNGNTVTQVGSIVESGYEYYVDVPIDSISNSDEMAIELQVVMKYGKHQDKTLIGNRGVIYMRRAMFSID